MFENCKLFIFSSLKIHQTTYTFILHFNTTITFLIFDILNPRTYLELSNTKLLIHHIRVPHDQQVLG